MTINLNSPEFNSEKKFLTKENILKDIDEYSIFRNYVGEFVVNSIQSSPFRKDNRSSFGIFYSTRHNCLLYKDLAKGTSGDCFALIANEVYPNFNYVEAMAQVVVDYGLQYEYILPRSGFTKNPSVKIVSPVKYWEKPIKPIGIRARRYTTKDYNFWADFGIGRHTLKEFNVVPLSHFTYGQNVFAAEALSFSYIERKDGATTYKIYQPHSKNIKFFTDMNASIHAGYTQLPKEGKTMLITKSMKDVMSIKEVSDIPAISVLSETVLIKPSVIDEYKSRFENVIVFFDNDSAGEKMAREYKKLFELDTITVPKDFKNSKDFSDVVKNEGEEAARNMLDNNIWLTIHKEINDLPF